MTSYYSAALKTAEKYQNDMKNEDEVVTFWFFYMKLLFITILLNLLMQYFILIS